MHTKSCWKRRNCSLLAISPFPSVFKRLVLQTRKNKGLFGEGLSFLLTMLDWIAFADVIDQDSATQSTVCSLILDLRYWLSDVELSAKLSSISTKNKMSVKQSCPPTAKLIQEVAQFIN